MGLRAVPPFSVSLAQPDNILMDEQLPRLADFEYSYNDTIPISSSVLFAKITLEYMAPEVR